MANWAIVKDSIVTNTYEYLPGYWNNISNFDAITDLDYLKSLGWYPVNKIDIPYNPLLQFVESSTFEFRDDQVNEHFTIKQIPITPPDLQKIEDQWNIIRPERDTLMANIEWRYTRYNRQVRLNIQPTDSIDELDKYMQDLADITTQSDPFNIVWPIYNNN